MILDSPTTPRVLFAPSPTGYLHVGGAAPRSSTGSSPAISAAPLPSASFANAELEDFVLLRSDGIRSRLLNAERRAPKPRFFATIQRAEW